MPSSVPTSEASPVRDHAPAICIVGSGWSFTSGISYYTCRLAISLHESYPVSVVLLRRLIPRFLYPGKDRVGKRVNQLDYPTQIPVYDGVDWYWGSTIVKALGFLRRQHPDVLVVQWWTGAVLHSQLLLAAAAHRRGAKVIIEFHETQDTGEARLGWTQRYLNLIGSRLIKLASAFVVHSEYDVHAVTQLFPIGERPVRIAAHGPFDHIENSDRTPSVTRAEVLGTITENPSSPAADDITVLLFFGTVRPYKGLEILVKVFNELSDDEAAKFRLVIVGETWENWGQTITDARSGRHRDKITVINRYVDDSEVADVFDLADVVVLPYTRSSASGPLHVAMSFGLPTILSDVGGLRDGAQGYEGVTWIDPTNESSLRDALLAAPAQKGQRFTDPRSWQDTVKTYVGIFDDIFTS